MPSLQSRRAGQRNENPVRRASILLVHVSSGGEGGIFAAFPEPQRFQWLRAASIPPCVPAACAEVELTPESSPRLAVRCACQLDGANKLDLPIVAAGARGARDQGRLSWHPRVISGNVIQADERVFEFWLNAPELSLLHLFRLDDRHEQIRLVQFSGMKRHFPAE